MDQIISTAEILCVGTELLLGDIVNTNAAFLSRQLAELGIAVYRQTCVGDNAERLKSALALALGSADLVITSGGLGPTYDDITKETVAEYFGLKLVTHRGTLEKIRGYFAALGRKMPENNTKQAEIPEGAVVFRNDNGTAPGLCVSVGDKTVIMLPGPPGELIPLFNDKVLPYLSSHRSHVFVSKNIHLFGIGESAAEEIIKDIMINSTNPTVAPYCKEGEVRLRVTAGAETEREASEMCGQMVSRIAGTEIGQYIYGVDVDSMEEAAIAKLRENSLTLAVAESCTGGLISKLITDMPGVSDVFLGGAVTYANSAKENIIGVSRESLDRYGAVSEAVALEMARGVREKFGSDVGVSATGVAGPSGGTEEKPVGCVFVAISSKDGEYARRLSLSPMRSRDYIRNVTAEHVFDLILKMKIPDGGKKN